MKEFARICMATGDRTIIRSLERLLNTEISIAKPTKEEPMLKQFKDLPREIDPHTVLNTTTFQFMPIGMKINTLNKYRDLIKEQDRTREAIVLLQTATSNPAVFNNLTSDMSKIFGLLKELDQDQSDFTLHLKGKYGTFEKLEKTTAAF